uniref:Putative ovule protein n=1 Tax=Solanum chacoense TaxID=4108 RepID=A0A0V0HDP8_SOLCH
MTKKKMVSMKGCSFRFSFYLQLLLQRQQYMQLVVYGESKTIKVRSSSSRRTPIAKTFLYGT